MAKYLDPKADLTFKKVFGEHKELLISFLNALLPLPKGKEIVEIEYKSPELVPVNPDKKDTIVDVRCTDKDGRNFIVEMQMYWTNAFKKRALLNTCKAYSYPADKGIMYNELKPVYTLSLVNDIAFTKLDDCYHVYTLTNQKFPDYKIDDVMMIFVELPKFKPQSFSDQKMRCLWLKFLTKINEHTVVVDDDLLSDSNVSQAIELVRESAYTDAELEAIDRYWDAVSREKTALAEKYELGEAKGRAEGRAEEREKAYHDKLNSARNLKSLGTLTIAQISAALGLAEDEVANA